MKNAACGLLFAALVQECLTGIAMRKKGSTGRDYCNPLTAEVQRPDA